MLNALSQCAPPGGVATVGAHGLVSFKTSDTATLPSDHESKMERRVGRLRRTVWASGHLHKFAAFKRERVWFVTLTYRPGVDWFAKHITTAIKACRAWLHRLTKDKLRYTWVAELQKRGAVHYHVAIWLPKGVSLPKFDKRGWWPHGMTQTVKSFNPIGYLMKYLSKVGAFHHFPKGCRLFGIGGLNAQARPVRTWINFPQWLKQTAGVGDVCRQGSRYVLRSTGEILVSPFRVVFSRAGLQLLTVGDVPTRWADGPYSTFQGAA